MTKKIPIILLLAVAFLSTGFTFIFNPIYNTSNLPVLSSETRISFAELGLTTPLSLSGPVSQYSFRFNFPADWTIPEQTITLSVDMIAYFASLTPAEDQEVISGLTGGDLSISLNGEPVFIQTLQESGEKTFEIKFSSNRLLSPSRRDVNELTLRWDGSAACLMNLLSNITILPTSSLAFRYEPESAEHFLNDFPVPFFINQAIQPKNLYFVLPEEPTPNTARAALIAAAGMGRVSQGELEISFHYENEIESLENNNLIIFQEWDSASSPDLQNIGLSEGEGLLQFSYEKNGSSKLLVGGINEGIVKAAQVLSSGQIMASGDTLIISEVNLPSAINPSEDVSLQELGAGELLLSPQSGLTRSFEFFIPAGSQAKPDTSFELILSHSQQLDYLRSGLEVKLNGYPTINLRLNDNTSNQVLFHLILPSNLTHPGRNTIEVVSTLKTRDICSGMNEASAWMRISAESVLHMPLEPATETALSIKTFADFPDQYLSGSALDNVLFLVKADDLTSLEIAGKLAFQLGSALPGQDPILLQVWEADEGEPAALKDYSVIEVGKPSDLPYLSAPEQFPALVFGSDDLLDSKSGITQVTKPVENSDVGYAAIRGYTGETQRILLAVLGNSASGLDYAMQAVLAPDNTSANFSLSMNAGEQISWMENSISMGCISENYEEETALTTTESNAALEFRKGLIAWAVPLMLVLLLILGFLVILEVRKR